MNCKKNNINKKSCMLILNRYPKRMQRKQAKKIETKYETKIHESKGTKPRNRKFLITIQLEFDTKPIN